MPILPILRLGHPALRAQARPVDPAQIPTPPFQQLIDDMVETMRDARGVGLAAPQVGVPLQVFVYSPPLQAEKAEDAEREVRVLVNPMLNPQSGELVYDWEGCLSIPDLRGLVPRHPAIRALGLDRAGQHLDYVASGFEARIIQHEFDHLNGVIFLDRMRDLRSLAFSAEWDRYMTGEGEDLDGTAVG